MLKSDLRKAAQNKRQALSESDIKALNQALLSQFTALDLEKVNAIHLFLPILEKKEPNTFLIIDWLSTHKPHVNIVIPRADFQKMEMTNHVYQGPDSLQNNSFNILEPMQEETFNLPIDLCLVPLLAFDLQGNRVGYGKGFYDRFLSENPHIKKIGMSFFEAAPVISDAMAHDVKLDACITPHKTYVFG